MLNNLLDYWYAQEFFSPCWPVRLKEDCNLTKHRLPWSVSQPNPQIRLNFDVYMGRIAVAELIDWLLSELHIVSDEEVVEKDSADTCLFAIKIDQEGHYVHNSFAISSLVWAICKLVSANSFNHELDYREFDELQKRIDEKIFEKTSEEDERLVIPKDFLEKLFFYVCDQVQVPVTFRQFTAWSRQKKDYANKYGVFPELNPATELLQSFYLSDIKLVQDAPTDSIRNYITAMLRPDMHNERIHIDCDTEQMQHWLAAETFPLGAWPSTYSPSLMQQLGINLAISDEQKVFSVNGPPGTGKTTLLKEIIVSNIVQRAIVLAGYTCPSDAFQKELFENPIDQFNETYYRMDSKLSAYGMIVASNNNAAVENISTELPKSIVNDRTGLFASASADAVDSTYFADVASELLGEPAWGLISARLGRKKNLEDLKERLWWAKDNVTLRRYYEDTDRLPGWAEAKEAFRTALDDVMRYRDFIATAQASLTALNEAEKSLQLAQAAEKNTRILYTQQETLLESKEQILDQLKNSQQTEENNSVRLKARIPFLKRVFRKWFKKDPIIMEWEATKKQIECLEIEIVHQQRECSSAQNSKIAAENELKMLIAETERSKKDLETAQKTVEFYRKHFGGNWPDAGFWLDITKNEASQSSCPWTSPEYDKLREELFYQALMLHKAFVLSSNEVKQNLMRLFVLWDGKIFGNDRKMAYSHLLNTLLLVIPVVSTTFASVQSFLGDIGAEELGTLIVDEAGQATPQSVLGAMWRTRKAIIVGDPLQVEPIVTIPKELRKRFADKYNIPPKYRLPEISVQMLADSVNPYGGIRTLEDTTLWLGCPLVTHRRCLDPMFSISNEVAYNDRMFFKTSLPKPEVQFLLKKSVWFDCGGNEKGSKNHAVQQQIDLAGKLLKRAIQIYNGLPDLYLITPFTTVSHELTKVFREIMPKELPLLEKSEIEDWIAQHCGTVHTFQGKEASEVLFILGCDMQSGRGAANWVGQKPNIVNVAVSRAKYRLGVIGDYALWKNISYVRNICLHLERMTDFDSMIN